MFGKRGIGLHQMPLSNPQRAGLFPLWGMKGIPGHMELSAVLTAPRVPRTACHPTDVSRNEIPFP